MLRLPWLDTSPQKPFQRFYAAIRSGMTELEVLGALHSQFPVTGKYPRPFVNRLVGPNHLGFILDPDEGRYDAEIVSVELDSARVIRKQYQMD
jgi:hypothetical protein